MHPLREKWEKTKADFVTFAKAIEGFGKPDYSQSWFKYARLYLDLVSCEDEVYDFYQVKKEDRNNHDDVFVKVFDLDLPPEVKNEDDKDNHAGTEN
jgi:hypothetical protein